MTKCVECGADTELHFGGVPVCPNCLEKVTPADLVENLIEPKMRAASSS